MAAKTYKKEVYNEKETKKLVDGFMFKKPEKMADGTIKTERYKTDIVMLDTLMNGGFPKGRIIAIGAEAGVGKTTALIQAGGNIVENYPGKKVYYFDIEGGATYELFEAMGYASLLYDPQDNPEGRLFLLSLSTIQELATVIKKITKDPDTALIVIDSDTAVTDGNMLEEDDLGMSNKAIGSDARMWSKASKPLMAVVKESEACMVIVHQARMDLTGFYPRITATGGNAAKHMAAVEIWGKRKYWIAEGNVETKKKEEAIGAYVEFSTKKNRLTKPFAKVEMPIFFGRGVSNLWAYKAWLENHTFTDELTGEVRPYIKQKGSWYDIKLPFVEDKVQGDPKVWEIVLAHVEEVQELVDNNGGFTVGRATGN